MRTYKKIVLSVLEIFSTKWSKWEKVVLANWLEMKKVLCVIHDIISTHATERHVLKVRGDLPIQSPTSVPALM